MKREQSCGELLLVGIHRDDQKFVPRREFPVDISSQEETFPAGNFQLTSLARGNVYEMHHMYKHELRHLIYHSRLIFNSAHGHWHKVLIQHVCVLNEIKKLMHLI